MSYRSLLVLVLLTVTLLTGVLSASWPDKSVKVGGALLGARALPSPDEDRAAIRKVLDDQVKAWNRADLTAFMAGYWSSEKLTFFSGKTRTEGWKATLDRYRKRYQAEGKEMGQLRFELFSVELLGPDAALVRGKFELTMKKEKPEGLFTLIFRRLPEGWRIVHDHTSS